MELKVLHRHGWTVSALAREFGVCRDTVRRELRRDGPAHYKRDKPTEVTAAQLAHVERRLEGCATIRGTDLHHELVEQHSIAELQRLRTAGRPTHDWLKERASTIKRDERYGNIVPGKDERPLHRCSDQCVPLSLVGGVLVAFGQAENVEHVSNVNIRDLDVVIVHARTELRVEVSCRHLAFNGPQGLSDAQHIVTCLRAVTLFGSQQVTILLEQSERASMHEVATRLHFNQPATSNATPGTAGREEEINSHDTSLRHTTFNGS
jgi:hypothetical protein